MRDYFLHHWDRFKGHPWGVLAHSTHLRGIGTYQDGLESPRIQVTLATGIPVAICRQVGWPTPHPVLSSYPALASSSTVCANTNEISRSHHPG